MRRWLFHPRFSVAELIAFLVGWKIAGAIHSLAFLLFIAVGLLTVVVVTAVLAGREALGN